MFSEEWDILLFVERARNCLTGVGSAFRSFPPDDVLESIAGLPLAHRRVIGYIFRAAIRF